MQAERVTADGGVMIRSKVWQVRCIENWVKEVLIRQLMDTDAVLLDLCAGCGLDLGKWERAGVSRLLAVCRTEAEAKELRNRWNAKKKPFHLHVMIGSIADTSMAALLAQDAAVDEAGDKPPLSWDAVAAFQGFQSSLTTDDAMRAFMVSVSAGLRPEGFFFGLLPDWAQLWSRLQKAVTQLGDRRGPYPLHSERDLFRISFENETALWYWVQVGDTARVAEPLVQSSALIAEAGRHGLDFIDMSNLLVFFDEHRRSHASLLERSGAVSRKVPKLLPEMAAVVRFYMTFVLVRRHTRDTGGVVDASAPFN